MMVVCLYQFSVYLCKKTIQYLFFGNTKITQNFNIMMTHKDYLKLTGSKIASEYNVNCFEDVRSEMLFNKDEFLELAKGIVSLGDETLERTFYSLLDRASTQKFMRNQFEKDIKRITQFVAEKDKKLADEILTNVFMCDSYKLLTKLDEDIPFNEAEKKLIKNLLADSYGKGDKS